MKLHQENAALREITLSRILVMLLQGNVHYQEYGSCHIKGNYIFKSMGQATLREFTLSRKMILLCCFKRIFLSQLILKFCYAALKEITVSGTFIMML